MTTPHLGCDGVRMYSLALVHSCHVPAFHIAFKFNVYEFMWTDPLPMGADRPYHRAVFTGQAKKSPLPPVAFDKTAHRRIMKKHDQANYIIVFGPNAHPCSKSRNGWLNSSV